MGVNYVTTQTGLLIETSITRGTLTEIWGIEQELIDNVSKKINMNIPMYDQEIQVKFDQAETTEIAVETSNYCLI